MVVTVMLLTADVGLFPCFPQSGAAWKDTVLSPLGEGTEVGIELSN